MHRKVFFGVMLLTILTFCGCVIRSDRGYRDDQPGSHGPSHDLSISYQGHFSGIGWVEWVRDGMICGGEGGPDMEAIRIAISRFRIEYQAHVAGYGWMNVVFNGETAGTTGQFKSMEAIKIWPVDAPPNLRIIYRTFVQGLGWSRWVSNGAVAGATGERRPIQAIQIRLEAR